MADNGYMPAVERLKAAALASIAAADAKATALAAIGGALLAFVAGAVIDKKALAEMGKAATCSLWSFFAAALVSVGAAIFVLWPRTSRRSILEEHGWTPLERSPSFFGDVATLKQDDFESFLSKDDGILARDAAEQAFVNAVIARRKMIAIRTSVVALLVALVALALVPVLR